MKEEAKRDLLGTEEKKGREGGVARLETGLKGGFTILGEEGGKEGRGKILV